MGTISIRVRTVHSVIDGQLCQHVDMHVECNGCIHTFVGENWSLDVQHLPLVDKQKVESAPVVSGESVPSPAGGGVRESTLGRPDGDGDARGRGGQGDEDRQGVSDNGGFVRSVRGSDYDRAGRRSNDGAGGVGTDQEGVVYQEGWLAGYDAGVKDVETDRIDYGYSLS
jgi:hypothetical protein